MRNLNTCFPLSGNDPGSNEVGIAQIQKLQQKIEELERRLDSSAKSAPSADQGGTTPGETVVNVNGAEAKSVKFNDAAEEPTKSPSSYCTLWGGPIMPSEDQNLW
jgi:hypothetical protein